MLTLLVCGSGRRGSRGSSDEYRRYFLTSTLSTCAPETTEVIVGGNRSMNAVTAEVCRAFGIPCWKPAKKEILDHQIDRVLAFGNSPLIAAAYVQGIQVLQL